MEMARPNWEKDAKKRPRRIVDKNTLEKTGPTNQSAAGIASRQEMADNINQIKSPNPNSPTQVNKGKKSPFKNL